ncbi:MAG: VOC family protein, partial [Chloroflexi bacterium]
MALNIKKIDSVSIRVRDLDKATKFYTETLGLPEIFRM